MVTEEQKQKAKDIIELALIMQELNPMYKNLEFRDKINLSAKIHEMENLNDIYIMLSEIDNSIIDFCTPNQDINFYTKNN